MIVGAHLHAPLVLAYRGDGGAFARITSIVGGIELIGVDIPGSNTEPNSESSWCDPERSPCPIRTN